LRAVFGEGSIEDFSVKSGFVSSTEIGVSACV
jgi:hypothetical protein